MQNKIFHVKLLVNDGDIDFNNSVYAGYTQEEVAYHVHAYQALYRGDIVFEIINARYELYYLHCKKGHSTRGQVDYMVSDAGIILINANGNLYKYDLDAKENLSIEAFQAALFDNTQSEYYPALYLLSLASQEYGLMAVVDTNGIVNPPFLVPI
jgi:hypothetical protein